MKETKKDVVEHLMPYTATIVPLGASTADVLRFDKTEAIASIPRSSLEPTVGSIRFDIEPSP